VDEAATDYYHYAGSSDNYGTADNYGSAAGDNDSTYNNGSTYYNDNPTSYYYCSLDWLR